MKLAEKPGFVFTTAGVCSEAGNAASGCSHSSSKGSRQPDFTHLHTFASIPELLLRKEQDTSNKQIIDFLGGHETGHLKDRSSWSYCSFSAFLSELMLYFIFEYFRSARTLFKNCQILCEDHSQSRQGRQGRPVSKSIALLLLAYNNTARIPKQISAKTPHKSTQGFKKWNNWQLQSWKHVRNQKVIWTHEMCQRYQLTKPFFSPKKTLVINIGFWGLFEFLPWKDINC